MTAPFRPGAGLVRAGASLAALAALVAGVPVALAQWVGWPLPRSLPGWDGVADALAGASVPDAVVVKALACAAWVLWALVVACIAAEAAAWAQGREPARLRGAGALQPAVRQLVVSAAVVVGALRPQPAPADVVVVPAVSGLPTSAVGPSAPEPPAAPEQSSARPSCVVAPRDSLWRLAERHLGDGLRWREIWELNRGAAFDGGRRFTDPDLILPGWVLAMPDDATGLDVPAPAPPAEAPEPPAPAPGPSPTALTAEGPGGKPSVEPSVPAPATPPAAGEVPPGPRWAPTPSSVEAPAGPPRHGLADPPDVDDPDHEAPPLLAASALAAAGVVAALTGLRRRQRRLGRPGRMIRLPGGRAARTEVHLRRACVAAPFDRLDLVLRALANCVGRRRPGACPAVSVLSVGAEAVEVLLTESVDAPAGPFEVAADGRAWTLRSDVADDDLRPLANAQSGPVPALVAVGTVDERTVMVDLEAGARTLIGGEPDDARALLWSIAVDLATSNRADDIDLVLVGKPPAGLEVLDRVQVVDDVEEVLARIDKEASATTAALAALRRSSTFDARAADPTLLLTPTVVLVADATPGPGLDRLLEAAGEFHGLAVVAIGPELDGAFDRELCVEADTLVVKPLGLRLRPAALPAGVVEDVATLLATAADTAPGPLVERDLRPACHPPPAGLTIGPNRLPVVFDADGQPVVPPGHVLVRVLGPVEVLGSERPIDRRRCVELIAYLALHREGADEGRIKAALWPEAPPTQGAFNETVSRARRLLGLDPAGVHHLLPVDNRRYRLGPYLATDAELLEDSPGGQAARLVRGLPFEGTGKGYEWAYEEGHAYRLAAVAEEAADASAPATRS